MFHRKVRWASVVVVAISTGLLAASALPSGAATAKRPPSNEFTASDAFQGDYFGYTVSVSGSTAVIGTQNAAPGAYVFVRRGSKWIQQAKLTPADGGIGDYFGFSVAVSGSTAVVGAYTANAGKGAAYVFVRRGSKWTQQAKLTAADGAPFDNFGYSVAVSGSTAVVGAFNHNSHAGAAYVFVRSGSTWIQQAELTGSDTTANDAFGISVALSGTTVVVGAKYKNLSAGTAYVFGQSGSTWLQEAELSAADGAAGDEFGWSVSVSGTTAVVGANLKNSQTGAAYAFVRSGSAWSQQAKLTAASGAVNDNFGISVSVSGSTAVVGAFGRNSNTGSAYVFIQSGSTWVQKTALTAAAGVVNDQFGYSVSVSGPTIVIGAPYKNSHTGAAYAFG